MDSAANHRGLLAGFDVFIGGPIQHAIVQGFPGPLRDTFLRAINAVREHGGNVFSAHVAEKFGAETAAFTPEQVSVRDFQWMKKCDIFVPILPVLPDRTLHRTDGTHIELGWATALGRPIVLITPQPFVDSASHLLKGLSRVGSVRAIGFDEFNEKPGLLIETVLAALDQQEDAVRSA
ncbi:nucleoside 2-deoxyribosyltransferase [Streptomyces sp. IBSBF 2435]|uniref:nucleoside 2-deoxyribosyltransferase n=1 Tax=Streptomyces sp. IBSBF 2435 TaxID=2903531 RepID=UPI002FDC31FF